MKTDSDRIGKELLAGATEMRREAQFIYRTAVAPTWLDPDLHGLVNVLYGYVMGVFSRIDLTSAYWKGSEDQPTDRMIGFLDEYFESSHEANSVAVQMWRHKLMHTAAPRYLHRSDGIFYRHLLHWSAKELPAEQHFTLSEASESKVINIAVLLLIDDLVDCTERYIAELQRSVDLQNRFSVFERQLGSYSFREYERRAHPPTRAAKPESRRG